MNRRDNIRCRWLPNGNLRFFLNDSRESAVGEMQCPHYKNVAYAVLVAHVSLVMIEREP